MTSSRSDKLGLLIVGHGSREPRSNQEFERFVGEYSLHRPDLEIRHAYIELAQPEFKIKLREFAQTNSTIIVLPLFLFSAGHTKNDIPLVLDEVGKEFPTVKLIPTNCIGVHPTMLELLHTRASDIINKKEGIPKKRGVIIVSRGSSDADANSEFYKLVRLFEESNEYSFVIPSFVGITKPLLSDSLEVAAKLRPEELLILPYFLFGGRLIRSIEEKVELFTDKFPWIKSSLAPHFGSNPSIFKILNDRIKEAVAGIGVLPCATCEYREQLPGLASKVGGLKALLWSVRHMETHSQAAPHEFPHRNIQKHILVCDNIDCSARGSVALIAKLRSEIKRAGKQKDFRVTRASCLGRCGEGPSLVVYPDGIWYQGVREIDAPEIVRDHLLNDRIVSRLVDSIMQ
ncbi:sirohydrochlorin cobaltochelatase [Leptospira broomii serovar Hurstbridge str. 5399]|uniref:Sirohydrochlorin cobaltochelatase n=1 Tax=Leptospira broomii serovar Hurstbridge str. 5399 TaxID=1049789 RepID=T0GHL4_9LEPT|nr:CbiX/SirB N-terminal domain-containing protein [Leptospira broomii]EQA44888.1 sirohydrochlorin cobaltochelatase [Leptospira broomii serovar Hurstbridge str. 5399]